MTTTWRQQNHQRFLSREMARSDLYSGKHLQWFGSGDILSVFLQTLPAERRPSLAPTGKAVLAHNMGDKANCSILQKQQLRLTGSMLFWLPLGLRIGGDVPIKGCGQMVKNHPSREKKPRFGAFANFLGINAPVVADLRLPSGYR